MPDDPHHEHLIKEVADLFAPIFEKSPQAVYIYLDDTHKICNKKFADMVGYASVEEWVANEFPVGDVLEEDQEKVIKAYTDASTNFKAAKLSATVVKKNGEKLSTDIIMTPFTYKNEVFVVHFISPKK